MRHSIRIMQDYASWWGITRKVIWAHDAVTQLRLRSLVTWTRIGRSMFDTSSGACKDRVALFSYTFGDWSRLLDINDPNDARDAIKRIDEILMERITVTAAARAIPD